MSKTPRTQEQKQTDQQRRYAEAEKIKSWIVQIWRTTKKEYEI